MIALCYLLGGVIVVALGTIVTQAVWLHSANSENKNIRDVHDGDIKVIDTLTANNATLTRDLATANNRADSEKARADALDTVLADHIEAGPVAGSFELLRQRWQAARLAPTDITSTRAMHPPGEASALGSALMRPGE